MKDTYIFPVIFNVASDGISIEFSDLPGCLSCADNMEEAFANAKEVMEMYLYLSEIEGDEIPEPTPIGEIHFEENETISLIRAWMPPVREEMANKKPTALAE